MYLQYYLLKLYYLVLSKYFEFKRIFIFSVTNILIFSVWGNDFLRSMGGSGHVNILKIDILIIRAPKGRQWVGQAEVTSGYD